MFRRFVRSQFLKNSAVVCCIFVQNVLKVTCFGAHRTDWIYWTIFDKIGANKMSFELLLSLLGFLRVFFFFRKRSKAWFSLVCIWLASSHPKLYGINRNFIELDRLIRTTSGERPHWRTAALRWTKTDTVPVVTTPDWTTETALPRRPGQKQSHPRQQRLPQNSSLHRYW